MDHLSQEQQSRLRNQLQETRERLRDEIREELVRADSERFADLAGQVRDPGDESVADLLSDINTTVVSKYIGQLRAVEVALERFNDRSYGICDECGTEIPYERLNVYPTAIRCIEDQERHERLFQDRANPTL
jgi:DnaK suppressor protein